MRGCGLPSTAAPPRIAASTQRMPTASRTLAISAACPGAQTTDGSAVFAAQEAWTRHGEVTGVIDRKTFVALIEEPRAADGWFVGGVLIWETGANAGRACEVRDWMQATGGVGLFLPQPFTIQIGDRFRVYPGCDKRFGTCTDRFDNALNFRGEPYLPGQDELMRYPDAK